MFKNRRITAVVLAIIMTFTITGQVPVFGVETNETPQTQEEQNPTSPTEGTDNSSNANAEDTPVIAEEVPEVSIQAEEDNANVVYQAKELTPVSKPTGKTWDGKTIDISWYNPSSTSFNIDTAAEFAGLAAIVNGSFDKTITKVYYGTDTTKLNYIKSVKLENFMFVGAGGGNQGGTCYKATGAHDFMGKTIKVTADLNMSGDDGKVNYMPIGGKYPMCDATGSMFVNNEVGKGDAHVIEAYFNGILDCSGHTITINCDRYTKSGFPYSMAAGLVGYIGEVISEDDVESYKDSYNFTAKAMKTNWAPTVRNVSLKGSVYARRMVGGVVGRVGSSGDSNLGVFVENCANHADVKSTDAKGVGGVIGAGWGTGKIVNCYNTGDIEATYTTCPVGGICAENGGMDIYNCYNIGTMSGNSYGRGIGSHDSGSYIIDNCFSLQGTNSDYANPIWYNGTATAIDVRDVGTKQQSDMNGQPFVNLLNSGEGDNNYSGGAFVRDDNLNNGYPVLYFEKDGTPGGNCTVSISDVTGGAVQGIHNGRVYTKDSSDSPFSVPYGSVIYLSETHDNGYVLKNFKAGAPSASENLIGDFVTVTEDLSVGADIVQLKKGTIEIKDGEDCTVVATKKGFVTDGADVKAVKRQKVLTGNDIYQQDVITISATLHENAVPKNVNQEYSGEFTYKYKYMDSSNQTIGKEKTSNSGKIVVDENIDNGKLVITAEPVTQPKTWVSFANTSWYDDYDGEGNYVIDSAEDLAGLAYLVNIEGETFADETIEIPKDTVISLKNTDGRGGDMLWPGIGVSLNYNYFAGTVIGNDCTILDMKRIDAEGSDGGLFNCCSDAKIKGLRVRGITKIHSNGAGIVGSANNCTIENCISYVSVTNQYEKGECAGGITGRAVGTTIKNCINRGKLCGYSKVGGIVGDCYSTISSISNCSNYGTIKTLLYTDSYNDSAAGVNGTGGICGRVFANIDNCANFGEIYSTDECTGGIGGEFDSISSTASVTITNSFNRGNIVVKGVVSGREQYAGGLFGYALRINIQNVYNAGDVTGPSGNENIYGVGYFGCGLPTVASTCYSKNTGEKLWGKPENKTPSKAVISEETEANMKAVTFASTLGSSFKAKENDFPTLTRFDSVDSIEKTCTVSFSANGTPLEGNSFMINSGGSVSLDEIPAGNWKKYDFTVGGEQWDGKNITEDITVNVTLASVNKYKAIFKIAGQEQPVKEVEYGQDDSYATLADKPDSTTIPTKDGFAAKWPDDVELNQYGDTIINAVYYPSGSTLDVQTTASVSSGTYYLGGKSTGTITIEKDSSGNNGSVKLIGDSGVCEGLNIVMEAGTTLQASNLQIACDAGEDESNLTSVLTMSDNCTLELIGAKNSIEGLDTDSKECVPAIKILGDNCVIKSASTELGEVGVLTATAETGDPVIDIATGKTLTFASGIMKLHKSSKIGAFDGGVINSGREKTKGTKGDANFKMTGGTLYCAANSDHMHAVKVKKFEMTAGDAMIASNDENKALVADSMNVTGGNLQVYSADYDEDEILKTEANRTYYYNKDAIDCDSFAEGMALKKQLSSGMEAPYDVYVGEGDSKGKFVCEGLKYKYNIDKDKLVKNTDNQLFVWTANDKDIKVTHAGTDLTIDDNARGYNVGTPDSNGNISITMTGTAAYRKGWYKVCAAYDDSGNMLEIKYNKISDNKNITMDSLKNSGFDKLKVFIVEDIDSLIPGLEAYEPAI